MTETTTTPPRRRTTRKAPLPPPGHRMTILNWITAKSTGDLLVLIIASTVCSMVLGAGIAVVILGVLQPGIDTSQVVGAISDIINTLIGLLAGFLAGRTDATQSAMKALEQGRDAASRQADTKAHAMSNNQQG